MAYTKSLWVIIIETWYYTQKPVPGVFRELQPVTFVTGWYLSARRPVSRVLSPPGKAGDGHSSGTPVAERLVRPTRAAARKPAWTEKARAAPIWPSSRWGLPSPPPLPEARCALTARGGFSLGPMYRETDSNWSVGT